MVHSSSLDWIIIFLLRLVLFIIFVLLFLLCWFHINLNELHQNVNVVNKIHVFKRRPAACRQCLSLPPHSPFRSVSVHFSRCVCNFGWYRAVWSTFEYDLIIRSFVIPLCLQTCPARIRNRTFHFSLQYISNRKRITDENFLSLTGYDIQIETSLLLRDSCEKAVILFVLLSFWMILHANSIWIYTVSLGVFSVDR